jgi:hypothetical protein
MNVKNGLRELKAILEVCNHRFAVCRRGPSCATIAARRQCFSAEESAVASRPRAAGAAHAGVGVNWPAMEPGVTSFPPMLFRALTLGGGVATLWLCTRRPRVSLAVLADKWPTVL